MKVLFSILLIKSMITAASYNLTSTSIGSSSTGTDTFQIPQTATISLKIKGNPTTGFKWRLMNFTNINDITLLDNTIDKDGYLNNYVSDSTDLMVGVGGVYNFDFIATKQSTTKLDFVYARPWTNSSDNLYYSAILKIQPNVEPKLLLNNALNGSSLKDSLSYFMIMLSLIIFI
jgi:predicted secreted protein